MSARSVAKMVARHNQHTWEATASHEDLLAWAENSYRWPRRRWRVEGTRAGNSRLLGYDAARSTRQQWGGAVVEVIPSRTAYLEAHPEKKPKPKRARRKKKAEEASP